MLSFKYKRTIPHFNFPSCKWTKTRKDIMTTKHLKTILIDLDGVLNKYNGNFDENVIPEIQDGAASFLENLCKKYIIKVFTTRNKILTVKWLIENKLDTFIKDVTDIKEPAWLHIDDRCINFTGDYDKTTEQIDNFKSWYSKD